MHAKGWFCKLADDGFKGLALRYTECSSCSAAAYCELMGLHVHVVCEVHLCTQVPWTAILGWDTNRRCQSHVKIAALAVRAADLTAARFVLTLYKVGCTSFRVFP